MRVATILVTACLALFASAESTSAKPAASTTDAAAAAANSAQAAITKCLDACKAGDVNCAAQCVTVPNPNAAQVSHTPLALPYPHHPHHHPYLHVPTLYTPSYHPSTSPNPRSLETDQSLPGQRNQRLRLRLPAGQGLRGRDANLLDVRAGLHQRKLLQPAVGHAAAHGRGCGRRQRVWQLRQQLGRLGRFRQLGDRHRCWCHRRWGLQGYGDCDRDGGEEHFEWECCCGLGWGWGWSGGGCWVFGCACGALRLNGWELWMGKGGRGGWLVVMRVLVGLGVAWGIGIRELGVSSNNRERSRLSLCVLEQGDFWIPFLAGYGRCDTTGAMSVIQGRLSCFISTASWKR